MEDDSKSVIINHHGLGGSRNASQNNITYAETVQYIYYYALYSALRYAVASLSTIAGPTALEFPNPIHIASYRKIVGPSQMEVQI